MIGACSALALGLQWCGTSAAAAAADADPPIEEIIVTGRPIAQEVTHQSPDVSSTAAADSAALLRALPGADFARIGPLTGQSYYRGLTDLRLGVRVDGTGLLSGGPNLMDPPLHYVPTPLVERIVLRRGLAPVSAGVGLNAPIEVELLKSRFGDSGRTPGLGVDANAAYRSAEEGVATGGMVAFAGRHLRAHVLGSFEDGDDLHVPGGRLSDTAYRRTNVGFGLGLRPGAGESEFSLDYRYHRSEAGTPALPLDVGLFRTHMAEARYRFRIGRATLTARAHGERIRHEMDNFSFRPAPPSPAMFRRVPAEAYAVGYSLEAQIPGNARGMLETVTLGFDGASQDHDADIFNPNNAAFFVRNFNSARRHRQSLWGEILLVPAEGLELSWGLRWSHVRTNAGAVAVSATLPPPVKMLAAGFNAADRRRSNDLIDTVLRASWRMDPTLTWHLSAGRRTRAPMYVERYAWLPLEITAGLADGNNHIGRIDLKPEKMWAVDGGFDLALGPVTFSPRLFWQRINDYIQGLPVDNTPGVIDSPVEMVSAANGDQTPLVFSNIDARIWGADLRATARLGRHLQVTATGLYNRGRRLDIADNLYRIAPARLILSASWRTQRWALVAEARLVSHQRKVSATNGELATPGYAVLNLRTELALREGVDLVAGVENLTDKRYAEHLGGFNRVRGSIVPVGARLPAAGVNGFVRLLVSY